MNIEQSNTYRKDLIWLRFDNDSKVQERQQAKNHQSYIPFSYSTYPSSSWEHYLWHDNNIPYKVL